jgi:hypothetical protein
MPLDLRYLEVWQSAKLFEFPTYTNHPIGNFTGGWEFLPGSKAEAHVFSIT